MDTELGYDKGTGTGTSLCGVGPWPPVGILGFVLLLWWAMGGKSDVATFADAGTLAVVGLGTLALLIASFGPDGIQSAFMAFSRRKLTPERTAQAAAFFRLAAVYALACGFLAALIGMVIILTNMDDPSALGPALAMVLLGQIYGAVLALLALVAATIVVRRESGATVTPPLDQVSRSATPIATAATALGLLIALAGFCAVLLTFV